MAKNVSKINAKFVYVTDCASAASAASSASAVNTEKFKLGTNDFITEELISAKNNSEFKSKFINDVYVAKKFRRITKQEACLIQGFPKDFKLPESRARWMKLIGNSVSVPVIDKLCKSIIETGVFETDKLTEKTKHEGTTSGHTP